MAIIRQHSRRNDSLRVSLSELGRRLDKLVKHIQQRSFNGSNDNSGLFNEQSLHFRPARVIHRDEGETYSRHMARWLDNLSRDEHDKPHEPRIELRLCQRYQCDLRVSRFYHHNTNSLQPVLRVNPHRDNLVSLRFSVRPLGWERSCSLRAVLRKPRRIRLNELRHADSSPNRPESPRQGIEPGDNESLHGACCLS